MTASLLRLAEATPQQVSERLLICAALVLPIGTIEYHGGHLPLGLDGLKAQAIAEAAAVRSGAVLAPTSWWAADGVPRALTLRLPAGVIEPLLVEALTQFAAMGFQTIVLVNGHFGLANSRLLRHVALASMRRTPVTVLPIADYEVLLEFGNLGDHAGHWETSLLLGDRPDLVRLDALPGRGLVDGVIGADPRTASESDGRRGLAHAGDQIATAIGRALAYSAEERSAFAAAVAAAASALDALAELRSRLPRDEVPPVLTPAWRSHLDALNRGDLPAARLFAEQKRVDPFL
jgi:creatinine amidohydrolase